MRAFKNQVENFDLVDGRASHRYLWTEKGALLHAKSLNTDKAWDVYDYLVDFYFRAKEPQSEEKQKQEVVQAVPKRVSKKVDVAQEGKICIAIQKLRKDINCMDVLLEDCIHSEWESTYIEKRNAALGMINTFARDFNALMDLKPKILEERYW